MNLEQFQKEVYSGRKYEKYFYYFFYSAMTIGGFFILYDVIVHYTKYDKWGPRYFGYTFSILIAFYGISGLILTSNKYRIILVSSALTINKKKGVIFSALEQFGNPVWDNEKTICCCFYRKKWWTPDYKIYLSFDMTTFYVTVKSIPRNYGAGIDLGEQARVRKNVINHLNKLLMIE
jgi:hypothetical protein